MAKRIPMIDGDEMDALTRWKKYLIWRAGERKRIKTKYNRRERRQMRLALRASLLTTGQERVTDTGQ